MRRPALILFAALAAASPSLAFASGSSAQPPINQSINRTNFQRTNGTTNNSAPSVVAEEPYNRGKAVFAGNYKLGEPKLTSANVAEKLQRLSVLQRALPAVERTKLDPIVLSKQLTNREMNALEYYLRMRFGKFISKAPSWAGEEPPPKVALSK